MSNKDNSGSTPPWQGDLGQVIEGTDPGLPPCIMGLPPPAHRGVVGIKPQRVKVQHLLRLLSHQGNAN